MAASIESLFASRSVTTHLFRGAIGFSLVGCAIWAAGQAATWASPAALICAGLAVFALRGCPTCWTLGLIATIARRRAPACPIPPPCRSARPGGQSGGASPPETAGRLA